MTDLTAVFAAHGYPGPEPMRWHRRLYADPVPLLALIASSGSSARGPWPAPAAVVSVEFAEDFAQRVRHDGSQRSAHSRTGGWLDAVTGDPITQGHAALALADVLDQASRFPWPDAQGFDRLLKASNDDTQAVYGLVAARREARAKDASTALFYAAQRVRQQSAYANTILADLRASALVAPDAFALELDAVRWLEDLPALGFVTGSTLMALYSDSGRPGALGRNGLYALADQTFGERTIRGGRHGWDVSPVLLTVHPVLTTEAVNA